MTWSSSLELDGALGVRPFAVLLLSAGGRWFPTDRAHMSFIERPSRSVFIGRSAASFALRPPLEWRRRPVADVQSGFWDSLLRTIRTAPRPLMSRRQRGRDCLGLFLSQACRHPTDGCAPCGLDAPHGPPAPRNRFRFRSAPGFLGNDRDDSAQSAAAGSNSTLPALQRFEEADAWLVQAGRAGVDQLPV